MKTQLSALVNSVDIIRVQNLNYNQIQELCDQFSLQGNPTVSLEELIVGINKLPGPGVTEWYKNDKQGTIILIKLFADGTLWGISDTGSKYQREQHIEQIWEMLSAVRYGERIPVIPTEKNSEYELARACHSIIFGMINKRIFTFTEDEMNEYIIRVVDAVTTTKDIHDIVDYVNGSKQSDVAKRFSQLPAEAMKPFIRLFASNENWHIPFNEETMSVEEHHDNAEAVIINELRKEPFDISPKKEEVMNFINTIHEVARDTRRNKFIVTQKWAEIMQRYLDAAGTTLAEFSSFASWVIKPEALPDPLAVCFIEKFGDVVGAVRMVLISGSCHEVQGIPPVGPCRSGRYQVSEKDIGLLVQQWDSHFAEDLSDEQKENDIEAILRMVSDCTDERDLKVAVGEAVCQFDQVHGENSLQDALIGPFIDTGSRMPVWMYLIGYMHAKRDHKVASKTADFQDKVFQLYKITNKGPFAKVIWPEMLSSIVQAMDNYPISEVSKLQAIDVATNYMDIPAGGDIHAEITFGHPNFMMLAFALFGKTIPTIPLDNSMEGVNLEQVNTHLSTFIHLACNVHHVRKTTGEFDSVYQNFADHSFKPNTIGFVYEHHC